MNLSWNGCRDAAAIAIGHALGTNKSLEELDMSFNRISISGLRGIAHGLKVNKTLKSLHLQGM